MIQRLYAIKINSPYFIFYANQYLAILKVSGKNTLKKMGGGKIYDKIYKNNKERSL